MASIFSRFSLVLDAKLPSWVGKSDKIRSDQVRSGQIRSEHGQTREDKTKTSQSGLISLVKTSSQGRGPFPPHLPPSRRGRAGFTPHIRMCPLVRRELL